MQAVVLVGGKGNRLQPLTHTTPKPMLPVVNIPFFQHTLQLLKKYGIEEVIVSSGYLGEKFKNFVKDGSLLGLKLTYVLEKEPLGTAGAVKNVENLLDNSTFLVLNGDILTDLNIFHLHDYHQSKKAWATISLTSVEDPTAFGLVPTNGDGLVKEFLEKPSFDEVTTHSINAGIYLLEPPVLDYIPKDDHYSFERGLFPTLLEKRKPLFGFPFGGYWKDIGTPANYLKAHHDILDGYMNFDFDGEEVKPRVFVGKNCKISSNANLFGPVLIGDNCIIEDHAIIFSHSTIGNNVFIGESAKIYDSVLLNGSTIRKFCIIKNSVIGEEAQVDNEVRIEGTTILGKNVKVKEGNVLKMGIKISPEVVLEKDQIKF